MISRRPTRPRWISSLASQGAAAELVSVRELWLDLANSQMIYKRLGHAVARGNESKHMPAGLGLGRNGGSAA